MEPAIELSKTRDFGEAISDSFLFVRQNLKPLLSAFFIFCGFFLLAGTVIGIMQQMKASDMFNNIDTDGTFVTENRYDASFIIASILVGLLSLLFYIILPVTILSFMALYKEKGNVAPSNDELWGYIKYYFLKVLGGSILNFLLLMCGFLCCFIPGIYLYPILGLVFPIMIIENTTYGYAFSQSFRLIKEHWWMVFGVLFITGLLISICAGVLTIPFQAVNVWNIFLHKFNRVHISTFSIVIGTILRELALVLYILPTVALGICYFSLTEIKDATGLMGRINQLGDNNADTNAPAEEY